MNYAFFLAPVFLDWAVAIMKSIREHDPDAQFIGLCNSTKIYNQAKKQWPDFFTVLEDFEAQEKTWVSASQNKPDEKIAQYEALLGPGVLHRIIIADRHVGAGYITGADIIHSKLFRATRNREALLNYLVRMMDYLDGFIVQNNVNCFFMHCVASGPAVAIGELCRARNARFMHLQPTRIGNLFAVDSSVKGLCPEISDVFLESRKDQNLLKEHRAEAAKILDSYRNREVVPEYVTYSRNLLKKAYSPLSVAKVSVRAGAKILLYRVLYGETGLRAGNHLDDFYMTLLKPVRFRATRNLSYTKPSDLKERGFVYFPLHVEPEASTMVVAPWHTNQLAIIENLSKNVPFNMPVVVKEHAPMVGVRPLWFYKKLAALPNVILVDPYENSLELMKKSALVATITGTVAWEAMIFGRSLLIMGESPFRVIDEGFVYYGDVTGLSEAIQKAMKLQPVDDAALVDYIAATLKVSFSCPMKLLWGSPDEKIIADHQDVTDRVARDIAVGMK